MSESQPIFVAEAHQYFAKTLHGQVWALLNRDPRTAEDDELMLCAAYGSCYHWLYAGTAVNQQRGQWLIARVNTVLKRKEPALHHAHLCLELTIDRAGEMEDFDRAFAFEGLARANALAGNHGEALQYLALARKAGQEIRDDEDRRIFFDELNGGEWYGIK